MRQSQVTNILAIRDNHFSVAGMELSCKFYRQHDTDPRFTAYTVDFSYNTKYPNSERDDDISVLVEVQQGNPPVFKILNIRAF